MQTDSFERLYVDTSEKLKEETPATHLLAFSLAALALANSLYFLFTL